MAPSTTWPDWFKNAVATAVLGVPVVLWLAVAHVRATDADTRSKANDEAIQRVDKQQGKIEVLLKSLTESVSDVKSDVKEIKEAVK